MSNLPKIHVLAAVTPAALSRYRQTLAPDPQLKLSIGKVELLLPHLIKGLQGLLKDYPGWEIVVAVAVKDHFYEWPEMGLTIRANEIIDGLQRQYFPKEFQSIEYEGSRRVPVV